jgi:membrane protease subunit HflK
MPPPPFQRNITPSSLPSIPRGVIVVAVWAILALIFVWTGAYTVPAESVGVVQRFGRYHTTVESGLQFKIPYGVDVVTLDPVRRQLKMEFGFRDAEGSNRYDQGSDPELERSMVTGDRSMALVEWTVQYRISDPRVYLFDVKDPDETMRAASEAVMREVVGDRTVDEVITVGRQEIESETLVKLNKVVQDYHLGLTIDFVQLKNVNPPRQVQASFDEVNQAQQEKQKAINIANGEYNKMVPLARGDAARSIDEARGNALKRVNEAEGDAQRFKAIFAEYERAPEVMRQRMYIETMLLVLPQIGRKFILDDKGQQILPFLQLTQENK